MREASRHCASRPAARYVLAGPALVEQDDAIDRRVKEAAVVRRRAASRATVHEHDRLSILAPTLHEKGASARQGPRLRTRAAVRTCS